MITVRPRPCPSCPYRRDVPSGIWDAAEYAKLRTYDGSTADQLAAGAVRMFDCHQRTGELCAGWAGCHDMGESLAVRLHAAEVDPRIYAYTSPVPLFASGAQAAEHGMRDLGSPGPAARRMIRHLVALMARKDG